MANIDTYLQQIMAAIYGEDVRGSIHDAIEAINDQVDAAEETMEQFVQGAMDTTLASTTKPAQGKAVGDAVDDLKSALETTQPLRTNNLITDLTEGYSVSSGNGNLVVTSGWSATDYLTLRPGVQYYWSGISTAGFAFYDINHKFVDLRQDPLVATANRLNNPFVLPDNIFYGRFGSISADNAYAAISAGELFHIPFTVDEKLSDLSQKTFEGQNARLAGILKSGRSETLHANMYRHGFADGNANGAYSIYHFSQRIVSVYKEQYPFDVKLTPDSGYGIQYIIFNDDGTITKSGATFTQNELTVPKYSKFMLSVNAPANATVDNIASHVTISYVPDAATDVYGVPTYYFANNYFPGKIDTIINKSPLDGLQFAFLTDVHCRDNAGKSPELIKYIKSLTNSVPFVVFGGDVLITTVPEGVGVRDDAQTWQTWMEKMGKSHVYQVQGNHDYLGYHYVNGERVVFREPLGVCRQYVIGNLEDADIVGVPGKLWYYLDIPTAKTRIIFLNDYDTTRNDGVFYGYNGMSNDQVGWVVNTALAEDDKRIIFVSHQTYDTEMEGENQSVFAGMQSLFSAMVNHTAYSYGQITKDFTNSSLEFVAHFCGHMHADASNVNNGVLTIQSTCDAYYDRSESVGTINEQAFDIVTVDYTNSKLFTTRIGSGTDREFDI